MAAGGAGSWAAWERGGDLEELAQAAHALHVAADGGRSPAEWSELTDAERDANRDSARFAPLLLAALGLTVRAGALPGRREALTAEELEAGARLEHLRWCRFTRAAGRVDHPDLVPWDALSDEVRELDRLRVRALPDLLAHVGCSLLDASGPHENRPSGAMSPRRSQSSDTCTD